MTFALFARPKKPTDTPAPRPAADGSRVIAELDKLESLPHLSDTAVRAMALSNNPDASLSDLADVIRRDGVLTAAALKMANSVVYRGSSEVTDVRQAVCRLGMRGCGAVVSAAGMRNIYAKLPPAVRTPCENILRHSLFVGGLSVAVARFLRLTLNGEAYTAGLLHDIGRVVMCVHSPDAYAATAGGSDADPSARRRERDLFGTDHCAVGMLFTVKNALPLRIGKAIQHHHDPDAESDVRPLTGVIALADSVANHLLEHRDLSRFPLDTDPAFAVLRRLVVSERAAALQVELTRLVVGCVREARAMLKSMEA
jgi:putative nucleotidyltransferase with HDIG domain